MKKIKIPYYRQKNDYFCGPAALKMALEFLGKKISQKKLAKIAGTTRKNGTNWREMARAARALGFEPVFFKKSNLAKAQKFLSPGKAVIVKFIEPLEDISHYSVVVKIKKGEIVLNDPLNGKNFIMREKDFIGRWNKKKRWFMVLEKPAVRRSGQT